MPNGKRLWRTEKGDLVEDGHAEALVLAYGLDDALTDEDAKSVRGGRGKVDGGHTPKAEGEPTPKPVDAPAKSTPARPAKK